LRNQVQKIEAFVDPYATHAVEKYISPAAKELEERSKKIRAKLAENAIHAWDKYIYYKSRRLREQAKKKYRAHLAPQNATDAGDKGISPAAEELGERAE
jgi:anaerobic ribonucleoside-triphosphate reductase